MSDAILINHRDLQSTVRQLEDVRDELWRSRDQLEIRVAERTRELAESEQGLSKAQEIAHVGSWAFDAATGRARWSDERYRIFGLEPGATEPTFENFRKSLHPDDVEDVVSNIQEALEREYRLDTECRIVRPDGELRHIHMLGEVIRDGDGIPTGMQGTVQDITDRVRAREALAAAQRDYRRLFEHANDSIFISDVATKRFLDINENAARRLGYSHDELLKLTFVDIDGVNRPESIAENVRTLMEVGEIVFEHVHRRKDGSLMPVEISSRIIDSHGRKVFQSIVRDISERKKAENVLREAKEEAELANRVKSEFLANMSHELRTPLNAILGFSNTIQEKIFGPLGNEKYEEYVDYIYDSGEHLLELINDILDLSKVEANALDLHEEPVDLAIVSQTAARLIRPRARNGRVAVINRVGDDLPFVFGEERRLKQILVNLLSNGVKFTEPGGEVVLAAHVDGDNSLALTVSDNGIGMDQRELEIALAPFGQVNNSEVRNREGTGLGLPLTRALVEMHGGTLVIDTEKGKGTTVIIRFPPARVVDRD
jgi:PAS domain S-box-containing protein